MQKFGVANKEYYAVCYRIFCSGQLNVFCEKERKSLFIHLKTVSDVLTQFCLACKGLSLLIINSE